MNYLESFREMVSLRGLRESTLKTYLTYITAYLDYVSDILCKTPEDVSWQELRTFVKWIQKERGIGDRTINYVIAQLRFFTLYVLHQPWDPYQMPYRKFDRYIPFVPVRSEVQAFINAVADHKAKMMIILMYSCGLRIGEVCNLRYEDIDRAGMRIHITQCKNRSDRYVPLSPFVIDALTRYWRMYGGKSEDYIFRSKNDSSKHVDSGYVFRRIQATEKALGWPHRFKAHTFRHAFATHFYESTGDLLALKELLGHRSINSTTVYVTLSERMVRKYSSPIESLEISYAQ